MKAALIVFFASLSGFASAQDSFPKEFQEFSASDIGDCDEWRSCPSKDSACKIKNLDCNIDFNKHQATTEEDHKRCYEQSLQFFQQCHHGQWVCTGRAVNGYKACTGTQDYKARQQKPAVDSNQAKLDNTPTDAVTLQPPETALSNTSVSNPSNAEQTLKPNPDFQNSKAFQRCDGYFPDNPCVRELFYLQGSVDRFRWNCFSGDLAGDQVHNISLAYYSKDLFPDGPKCGTVQGQLVRLTTEEYKPVCDKCIKPHT